MKNTFFFSLLFLFIGNSSLSQSASEYVNQGTKLHDQGNYSAALKKYKKALKVDKHYMTAHYEMAFTYNIQHNYKKAIKHSDIVIASDNRGAKRAHDIKGTALDEMGKPYEAIDAYRAGIKAYPNFYLLHYNLGLTLYKTRQYAEAEKSFINALKINPNHATSHLLLSFVMDEQHKRVQALLAAYYFLVVESNTKRSAMGIKTIKELLSNGVDKTGKNNVSISLSVLDSEDPFKTTDMLISMTQALYTSGDKDELSPSEKMKKMTSAIFESLSAKSKDNSGFWWDFYVDFFQKTKESEHFDAFCYYIFQKSTEGEFRKWVKDNPKKVQDYKVWRNKNKNAVKES